MPITDNGFERYTKEEIYDRLVAKFESQFDSEVEVGDIVKEQFEALAETLYENQEASLQAVYRSAYLQDATGNELEKLASRLGLDRREAVGATGVIELFREDIPSATYTIPRGTTFQTKGSDPIQYDTRTQAQIALRDDFEDGNIAEYAGDTGDWNAVTHSSASGTYALEKPAVDDSLIRYTDNTFTRGTTFNFDLYANADTATGFLFGIESLSNGDYYEALVDEFSSELTINVYENGSIVDTSTTSVSIPANTKIHVEVQYGIQGDHELAVYDSAARDSQIGAVALSDEERYLSGESGFASRDATATAYIDTWANTHATANIRAVEGGVDTNLSSDTITEATESLTGVDGQTNPLPVGDSDFSGTGGEAFIQGRDRETDEQLRERAFQSSIIGGAATTNAIASAIREIEHVDSLTLYRNKTDSDDTSPPNGTLPSHSFEAAIYYNGPDEDIAEAIFGSKAIDSTDHGGAYGTEVTYDIVSDVLAETETIHWSSVPETELDIDLTLVIDEEYVGNDEIRSIIVNYVGGTDVNGESVGGLSVGDDLYVAVLEDVIVGPSDTGVWAVDSVTIDSNSDGTDDTTTLANGAQAYSVASNEVVVTNGRDGSITISTVQK